MPFLTEEETKDIEPFTFRKTADTPLSQATEYSFGEKAGAAFRQENLIGSYLAHDSYEGSEEKDPNFSAVTETSNLGTKYSGYADRLVETRNKEEFDFLKGRLDQELLDRQINGTGGWQSTLLMIGASIADPISLGAMAIPGANIVKGGRVANMLAGAAAVTAETAVQETLLHTTQETRTAQESVFNTVAGGLVGGVLGGVVKAGTKNIPWKEFEDSVTRDVTNSVEIPAGSVGAMKVSDFDPEGTVMQNQKIVSFLSPMFTRGSALKAALSESAAARKVGLLLHTDNWRRVGDAEGNLVKDTPVLTKIEKDEALKVIGIRAIDDNFRKLKAGTQQLDDAQKISIRSQIQAFGREVKDVDNLTRVDFDNLVAYALRNSEDVVEHTIPEVAAAANKIRREIFGPMYDRMKAAGLLNKSGELIGAKGYLPRVYNTQAIIDNRDEFIAMLTDQLRQSGAGKKVLNSELKRQRDLINELGPDNAPTKLTKKELMEDKEIQDEIWKEANELANRIADDLVEGGTGMVSEAAFVKASQNGFTKERVLRVSDNALAPYLEQDLVKITNRYIDNVSPQTAMMENFGTLNSKNYVDEITVDYDVAIAKAKKEGKVREEKRLRKEKKSVINEIQFAWDNTLGKYKNGDEPVLKRAGYIARAVTAMVLLGGQTVSSLGDLSRLVMVHGVGDTVKVFHNALSKEYRLLAREEAEAAGTALDVALTSNFDRFMDTVRDGVASVTKPEQMLDKASSVFQTSTGIKHWSRALKTAASTLASHRVIKNSKVIAEGGSLSKLEKEYMSAMGITPDMSKRIAKQSDTHGEFNAGLNFSNSKNWDDMEAKSHLRSAMNIDANTTINTPLGGLVPLWAQKNVFRKMLFQFSSFVFASHNQTLINAVQRGNDKNVYLGGAMAITMGVGVDALRDVAAGRERPDSWLDTLYAGIDRSGIAAAPMWAASYLNLIQSQFTGKNLIPGSLDYRPKSVDEGIGGPAYGLVKKTARNISQIPKRDFPTNVEKLGKSLPWQNWGGFNPYGLMADAIRGQSDAIGRVK